MQTSEILNAYRRAVTEIDELERQVEQVIPSGGPSGVRGGLGRNAGPSTNNAMAAAMQMADGMGELVRQKKECLARLDGDVNRLMAAITDGREYQIVTRYYLMGESDDSIGMSMGLSRSRIGQIRRRFLERSGAEGAEL